MNILQIRVDQKGNIKIYDELHFDGRQHFTCEYNKVKRKMTQIGVSVKGANHVIVKQFDYEVARLTLDEKTAIWYHAQKQWIENNYLQTTDSIFGINAGGSFEVLAYDKENELIATATVNITPGTMSIAEYKQMQQEVRRLFELFSYDLSNMDIDKENILRRVQLPLFPQATFKILIDRFVECFNEIVKIPQYQLTVKEKKVNIHEVKKWTPAIIIENSIKQNRKVTALISEKTTDIQENRMIKFMVEEFQLRVDTELAAEENYLTLMRDELKQLEEVVRKEQSTLVNNFRILSNIVKSDCNVLEKRVEIWKEISKKIEEILDHQILQIGSEVIEETHLFRMHPFYSEIFDVFMSYEKLTPIMSDTFKLFIQSILKSPTLYEIWILLKIIQHISQWGVNPKEFIDDIQEQYINSKSISGYRKQFRLKDKPFDIGLYYDFTFEDTGYRPDFVIGFFNKKNSKWYFHTLDAKYKSYSKIKQSETKILKDLSRSATRYVEELFSGRLSLYSATLVHTDIDSLNWNVKHLDINPDRSQHKIGHFYLTPNESNNLSIYLKKLLHECSQFEPCCPKCANVVKGIKEEREPFRDKLRWKTTYICEECEEVWVANYCSTCFFVDRGMRRVEINGDYYRHPRPLYKYPTYNYNLQVDDNWDVHCPTCYKTANHWRNYTIHENVLKEVTVVLKEN